MPELRWDEQDFLQCLAVVPEVEEYAASYTYIITDDILTLVLTLWQRESMGQFTLRRAGSGDEVTSFALVIRDSIRCRDDRDEKWGEYLEFRDCVLVPRRFYMVDVGDVFDRRLYPAGVNVELSVHPQISIRLGPPSHR